MTRYGGSGSCFLAAFVTLGLPALAAASGPRPASPPPPVIMTETVQGRLLRIDGEVYVIKDDQGREIRIQAGKDSFLDKTVQAGEMVAAEILTGGHARSIRKAPR